MSYTRPIIPVATVALTGAGTSASVDLVQCTTARLRLLVSAISGTITVSFATSTDRMDWRPVSTLAPATVAHTNRVTLTALDRYVRCSWALTGTATLAVAGDAVLVYATTADLNEMQALDTFLDVNDKPHSIDVIEKALESASDEADDCFGTKFTRPLIKWPDSHRRHVVRFARYNLMTIRGYATSDSYHARDPLRDGRTDAVAYWKMIGVSGGGDGFVDQTPTVDAGGAYVVTGRRRGWGGR